LPLGDLDWKVFEHLCCRIVEREAGIVGTPHLYGVPGENQKGIDIVAERDQNGAVEKWCYQCKRRESFSEEQFKEAIRGLIYEADHYVFFLSSEAKAPLRDVEANNDKVELWDVNDISRKLKNHRDLVAEFFHPAWLEAFFAEGLLDGTEGEAPATEFGISGTVYDQDGHPKEGVSIKVVVDGRVYKSTTNEDGRISVPVEQQGAAVVLSASSNGNGPRSSAIKSLSWAEATEEELRLHLKPERELTGTLSWCGTREPVVDAEVSVDIPGDEVRSARSNSEGHFKMVLPDDLSYTLKLSAGGGVDNSLEVVLPRQRSVQVLLARSCDNVVHETLLTQRICDDLEMDFVIVPGGSYRIGPPERSFQTALEEFCIARFPVTCLQYSFYLQHNPAAPLPMGWQSRFAPSGREKHPIVGISWPESLAFCEWLTRLIKVSFSLPTEIQWEIAARGSEERRYPWGGDSALLTRACNSIEGRIGNTTAVDNYPLGRSPFGAWDMAGNVWEWTSSSARDHTPGVPSEREAGTIEDARVARGGSYLDPEEEIVCFSRTSFYPSKQLPQLGFRPVREKGY
jgi:formylglycine-generating enzyme required for sulfatase activity